MAKRVIYDRWLVLTMAMLVVGGLFMVGSASNYTALDAAGGPSAYLARHALHSLFGFAALVAMLLFPYQRLHDRRLIITLLAVCLGGLLLALAMPAQDGARRWIPLGLINCQPSELAKLFTVVFMAYVLSRREEKVNDLWAVPIPCLTVVGSMTFLIVIEPDLGSGVMLAAVAGVMLFAAGLRWAYIGGIAGLGVLGLLASVLAHPYRLKRIHAFLNPSEDILGAGFQINQSLIALGSGGITGFGLGQSQQKAYYLPAPHTDFIFSVIGEEFGLIGCLALLAAFLVLFWRGMRAAMRAPDRFGFYVALGITHLLVLQALINICVCLALLPTKGLPLPFISYGGSSLVVSMAAMGMLLNVSKYSN